MAAHFDPETVKFLKKTLEDAWNCVPPERQAATVKTTLAERILKSAAEGERNRGRLLEVALRDLYEIPADSVRAPD